MKLIQTTLAPNGAQLTGYLLENSIENPKITQRPAVLVFPGGGYAACSDREGEPIALAYLMQGYHAFVLRYTTDVHKNTFPAALQDAKAALAWLHSHAEEYAIDKEKIAVSGFSAGGHLAACLGTMSLQKPSALILGYPVILAQWGQDFGRNLPGADEAVTAETPPTFVFSTQQDTIVPIENSLAFCTALAKAKVPFEQHIYLTGGHGISLGIAATSGGKPESVDSDMAGWLPLSVRFLKNLWGDFPLFPADVSTASSQWIDQPLPQLLQNENCAALLKQQVPGVDNLPPGVALSLRRLARFSEGSITEKQLEEIEQKLMIIFGGATPNAG